MASKLDRVVIDIGYKGINCYMALTYYGQIWKKYHCTDEVEMVEIA